MLRSNVAEFPVPENCPGRRSLSALWAIRWRWKWVTTQRTGLTLSLASHDRQLLDVDEVTVVELMAVDDVVRSRAGVWWAQE